MENQQNIFEAIKRVVHDEMQPMRDEIHQFKNEILTSNDKVIKELKDLRTEVTAFHGGQRRQDDQLQEHSHRLKIVESKVGV